jgi:glycosyltransferase involved in cell wall biosynthesis
LRRPLIGLNLLFLQPGRLGGTETYARELIAQYAELAPRIQFVLFLNSDCAKEFDLPYPRFRPVIAPVKAGRPVTRHLVEQFYLPWLVQQSGVDILHSMGYVCPSLVSVPQIVTIHDMAYKRCSGHLSRSKQLFWNFFIPRSARCAEKVIAVSDNARKDMLTFLPIPPDKVTVIHSGVQKVERPSDDAIQAAKARYAIGGDYVLAVGCGRHKRIDLLTEAIQRVRDLRLVVTGLPESGKVPERGPAGIRYVGFVSRPDLVALYAGARAYVTASDIEGFGFTVLEAMMLGTPVVSSNAGSLPEVCGDAALMVTEQNAESYSRAIRAACCDQDLRSRLIKLGAERVEQFSWKVSAEKHLDAYLQLMHYSRKNLSRSVRP